jgi:hypothetical protein
MTLFTINQNKLEPVSETSYAQEAILERKPRADTANWMIDTDGAASYWRRQRASPGFIAEIAFTASEIAGLPLMPLNCSVSH